MIRFTRNSIKIGNLIDFVIFAGFKMFLDENFRDCLNDDAKGFTLESIVDSLNYGKRYFQLILEVILLS